MFPSLGQLPNRLLEKITNTRPGRTTSDSNEWDDPDEPERLETEEEKEERLINKLAAYYELELRAEESAHAKVNEAREEIRKKWVDSYEELLKEKARELAKERVAELRRIEKAVEAERKWHQDAARRATEARRNRPSASPPRKF